MYQNCQVPGADNLPKLSGDVSWQFTKPVRWCELIIYQTCQVLWADNVPKLSGARNWQFRQNCQVLGTDNFAKTVRCYELTIYKTCQVMWADNLRNLSGAMSWQCTKTVRWLLDKVLVCRVEVVCICNMCGNWGIPPRWAFNAIMMIHQRMWGWARPRWCCVFYPHAISVRPPQYLQNTSFVVPHKFPD